MTLMLCGMANGLIQLTSREPAFGKLEAWWNGKVGIERSLRYKFMVDTSLFDFELGKINKIQAGSVNDHCFILADGELLLEGMDPDPT